jgi:hypothetical protein
MTATTRNRLIIGAALVIAGAVIGYQMFFAMTPPRHADHDHAIATLDAGGFLWIEAADGVRRNLVGVPDKVLVLHWFDPTAVNVTEQRRAASFAATMAGDDEVDFLFIAQAQSWDGVRSAAAAVGIDEASLYLDAGSRTGDLCGVRRQPETLVFDPKGLLAYQSKGPARWSANGIGAQIGRAKGGVEEIH